MPSFDGLSVVVAGAGVTGASAARVLRSRGSKVTILDDKASELEDFEVVRSLPDRVDLVVTSPGFRPTTPALLAALDRGIEVIGDVELAWRVRPEHAAPWLALTGTNGKTTSVKMLERMLGAAGHRVVAAGNVGLPLLDAVLSAEPYDVLAVELSSFQLHWSSSIWPAAAALLNLADDHTDWHGSFREYVAAKERIFHADVAVGNADDSAVRALLERAETRRASFTLSSPRHEQIGIVEDLLVDRAFPDVPGEATELATLSDLPVSGDHNVANALAAATLARAFGVPATAVRDGLRGFVPEPHRNALVAVLDGVTWIDDSKATNPHAAAASLAAYSSVVWVAGGLLKGANVDDLVRNAAARLRAAVLLGTDRAELAQALSRHAPDVPVVEVARLDTEAMHEVVAAARSLAQPGDTVLLAPAAASMDCFRDYKQRGDLFAAAVRSLA
jgi:UDP-N-acetylmuramoylalanine--D-glutamate ligase